MLTSLKKNWLYGAVLLAALIFHAWSVQNWHGSFDSDEAIPALMAKRMVEWKEFPVYFYGHNYGGSLSSLVAIPFMWIFGINVIAVRLSVVTCLFVFYILHALYVEKSFGKTVSILGLIYITFPGFSIHTFVSRFSAWWHIYLLLWMLLLLLFTYAPHTPKKRLLALFGAGILIGLNLWTITSTLLYVAALLCVWLFQSEEWKRLYAATAHWFTRHTRLSGSIPFVIAGLTISVVSPFLIWTKHMHPLAIVVLAFLLLAFMASKRKKMLLGYISVLASGFFIGNFPQWAGWMWWGIVPQNGYDSRFPTSRSLTHFAQQVVPSFFGIRPLPELFSSRPIGEWIFDACIFVVCLAAIAYFCWRYRGAIKRVLTLSPLEPDDTPAAIFFLLFASTWILMIGLPVYSEGSVRYMATAWQPFGIMSGIFLAAVFKKSRMLGGIILCLWVIHFCVINVQTAQRLWGYNVYPEAEFQELEQYLTEQGVTVGYADFWDAYALDFITQERLIISEYQRFRFTPYRDVLDQTTTNAYLMRFYVKIPKDSMSLETLAQGIAKRNSGSEVLPGLAQKKLLSRKQIGTWDIWIVQD